MRALPPGALFYLACAGLEGAGEALALGLAGLAGLAIAADELRRRVSWAKVR